MNARCRLKFLSAIKKSLVEACDFAKQSLWVDEHALALYRPEELIASTRVEGEGLQVAFGPSRQVFFFYRSPPSCDPTGIAKVISNQFCLASALTLGWLALRRRLGAPCFWGLLEVSCSVRFSF